MTTRLLRIQEAAAYLGTTVTRWASILAFGGLDFGSLSLLTPVKTCSTTSGPSRPSG